MPKKSLTSTEIKKMLKEKNLVIGTERTIKNLKLGKVEKVIVTSNCSEKTQKDIEYYAGLGKAEVLKIKYPNEELGIMCKKPFAISVLSILKGATK
jgi:large subunit ribosomal protein L30e